VVVGWLIWEISSRHRVDGGVLIGGGTSLTGADKEDRMGEWQASGRSWQLHLQSCTNPDSSGRSPRAFCREGTRCSNGAPARMLCLQ
jgi:hypothetical protein